MHRQSQLENTGPYNESDVNVNRSLKIILCCNTAFGVANFRAGIIRALTACGHQVAVVAPEEALHTEQLRSLGAEFIPWGISGRGTSLWHEIRALRKLEKIYWAWQPDVAFHYTIKPVIYGAIAGKRTGVPCISVITGLGYVFLNKGWISRTARALYKFTLNCTREIWFLNQDDQATFRKLGLVKDSAVRTLPGEGIDMQYFKAMPSASHRSSGTQRVFLMIARLLRDKGIFEFVEAARIIRRQYPETRFQLLGSAASDNPSVVSRTQLDEWLKEGVVEYLGMAQDVRPAIAAADCVVLPSYREGVPRSLLEAAAMERPVVATDVPGCRDVVLPGRSGLLCQPANSEDLAEKMTAILHMDHEALAAMGRCGREHVAAHFDESIVVSHYLAALGRLPGSLEPAAEQQAASPRQSRTH